MQVVGLHKEATTFFVACLTTLKGGQVAIEYFDKREGPLSLKGLCVVTGVEGHYLLIRHLHSPLKKKRALYKVLPFQLEALIPYSLDDVIVNPFYTTQRDGTQGTFFTVAKKFLKRHISDYQKEGVDPDWVSFIPTALFRFGQFISPQENSLVVFHVGYHYTQLVCVQEEMVQNHLTIHIGKKDFLQAFNQDNSCRLTNIQKGKAPHLHQLLDRFKREVDRAFCFFSHKGEEKCLRRVLFCGEMAGQIQDALLESKTLQFSSVAMKECGNFGKDTLRLFAIPIGLCLDVLKKDRKSIQLRQGEYISRWRVTEMKRKFMKGAAIFLMVMIMTISCSYMVFKKREKILSRQVESLAMEYKDAIPSLVGVREKRGIEQKMHFINQQLTLSKSRHEYFSPPPRVSDFLAFIATHPKLKEIELLQIDYELKSYPTLDHLQTKYLPKVRILFSSKEAQRAQEFYNAIVKDRQFVNNNREVEWNRKGSNYEIAFFLLL